MRPQQDVLDRLGTLDCAIIGGGVSGLYAGWRLLESRRLGNVAVFEMSDRTGGRLLTWLPYGPDAGLRAELGGMRFFEQQQLVWNLIAQLGLEKIDFYVDGPNLLWYLRGERSKAGDANAATRRYDMAPSEQGKTPDALIQHALNVVLESPANQAVIRKILGKPWPESRADWDAVKPYLTYKGRLLWDLGFWNILSDIVSYEAYQYIQDAFGYYTLTRNWNAAEAMQSIAMEFTQNPAYKTLVRGFSALPDTLRQRFVEAGGQVLLEHQLLRFVPDPEGGFQLWFLGDSNVEVVARARSVILALPRRGLELLQPSGEFDLQRNAALRRLLESVQPQPAFKLFLLYSTRWWETKLGIIHGRSVCDLPIRQTYYFRPDGCEQQPPDRCGDEGLLMASYDDGQAVDYWKGMELPREQREAAREDLRRALVALVTERAGRGGTAPLKLFSGMPDGESVEPPPNLHKASDEMIARASAQLALLHGLDPEDIPKPLVGAYADWTLDPFGGGWNFWQPQVNVKDVMQTVKKPLGDAHRIYIVGEAYSGVQGWVEGALTTAELVLENEFGLGRPSWLPPGYDLGW